MEILTQTATSRKRRNLETQGMQLSQRMHPNQHTYVVFLTHDTFWRNIHIVLLFLSLSIYEKLIQFCSIDELGTNYPKDMFDPHGWSEDSYYEALGKLLYFFSKAL